VTAARLRGVSPAVAELIGACTCPEPGARLRAADVAAAAGSLATQKLSRCARGSLRDWLATLRPNERQGSALDDLMGLCLVPVPGDGARTFTVSQVLPGRLSMEVRTSSAIEVQAVSPAPAKRSQHVKRWAAAVAVAAAAAAFVAMRPAKRAPEHGAEPEPAIALAVVPGSALGPMVAMPAGSAVALDLAPTTRLAASVSPIAPAGVHTSVIMTASQTTSPQPYQQQHTHRARRLTNGLARLSESDSMARGWLRVGGSDYLGGKVVIDGVPLGFAPLEHPLPVGMHSLTVVSPGSGQVLVRRVIHVGIHHTRVRPLTLVR